MVREKKEYNSGKFFLMVQTKFGPQFYLESGIFDVGTEKQEPYLYWTKYRDGAHGFRSVKSARAMGRKLLEEHGICVQIMNRKGVVV